MKKIAAIFIIISLLLAFVTPVSVCAKMMYRTYTVIKVTEKTIVLRRTRDDKKVVTVSIERRKRPSLRVGDRVRYDKNKKRLGRTLPPRPKKKSGSY